MVEALLVICTLDVSGGYFFGSSHRDFILTNSKAQCFNIAHERGVHAPWVNWEIVWLNDKTARRTLAETCRVDLSACEFGFNIPLEWRTMP